MSVKVNTLSNEEIRSIGDAFGHYVYESGESGLLCLGKSREAISDYICGYVRMAIRERTLYSTSDDHEAFISFKRSDVKSTWQTWSLSRHRCYIPRVARTRVLRNSC